MKRTNELVETQLSNLRSRLLPLRKLWVLAGSSSMNERGGIFILVDGIVCSNLLVLPLLVFPLPPLTLLLLD